MTLTRQLIDYTYHRIILLNASELIPSMVVHLLVLLLQTHVRSHQHRKVWIGGDIELLLQLLLLSLLGDEVLEVCLWK